MSQSPYQQRPPGPQHRRREQYQPSDPYARQPYGQPQYGEQPAQPQYGQQPGQPSYGPRHGQPQHGQPAARPQRPPAPPEEPGGDLPSFRLPGMGVLLSLAGLVVQVVSLFLLPWINTGQSATEVWSAVSDASAGGFGGWYVVLAAYPLAALSVLLALAAVMESVAMKMVWVGLTALGLGYLALRFGLGPVYDTIGGDAESIDFSTSDIVIGMIAVACLVVLVFVVKMAVSMFRRIAVVILLALAGVHVYAVTDLVGNTGLDELSFGAFGPALGYVLCAAAAIMPRRLPGM